MVSWPMTVQSLRIILRSKPEIMRHKEMEPSLRSSNVRASEIRLRRCDKSLHETIQRFVESLAQSDCRISQYADLAYATKKMQRDPWYWLESAGRVGFLVFMREQPIVWIDEQFRTSFRIPMRVSHTIYERGSLMIASLDLVEKELRLEDVWHLSGESYNQKGFSDRWKALLDMYTFQYKPDTFLQQGLSIVPAKYQSLEAMTTWREIPAMMYAQGEHAQRRLRVQIQAKAEKPASAPSRVAKPLFVDDDEDEEIAVPQQQPQSVESDHEEGEIAAKAVVKEDLPDTYELWIGGKKKGYGAVQDLDLSTLLREKAKKKKEFQVKVIWNEEFRMYEISSLLSAE